MEDHLRSVLKIKGKSKSTLQNHYSTEKSLQLKRKREVPDSTTRYFSEGEEEIDLTAEEEKPLAKKRKIKKKPEIKKEVVKKEVPLKTSSSSSSSSTQTSQKFLDQEKRIKELEALLESSKKREAEEKREILAKLEDTEAKRIKLSEELCEKDNCILMQAEEMESMREQAKKAKKMSDEKEANLGLLVESTKKRAREEIDELSAKLEESESKRSKIIETLCEKENCMLMQKEEMEQLKRKSKDLQGELDASGSKLVALKEERCKDEVCIERLKEEKDKLKEQLKVISEKLESLKKEYSKKEKELDEAQLINGKVLNERIEITHKYEDAFNNLRDLKSQHRILENKFKRVLEQKKKLEKEDFSFLDDSFFEGLPDVKIPFPSQESSSSSSHAVYSAIDQFQGQIGYGIPPHNGSSYPQCPPYFDPNQNLQ